MKKNNNTITFEGDDKDDKEIGALVAKLLLNTDDDAKPKAEISFQICENRWKSLTKNLTLEDAELLKNELSLFIAKGKRFLSDYSE